MQVLGGCTGAATVVFMPLNWGKTVPGLHGCCHLWHSWSGFSSFVLFSEGLARPQNKFLWFFFFFFFSIYIITEEEK